DGALVEEQLPADETTPDPLRARVNLALIGVFLLFAALWVLLLWYRYDATIRAGERRADNLAMILTDHLRRSIAAVDAALVQLVLHSDRIGGPQAQDWVPVLRAAHAGATGVSAFTVLDDTGRVTASTVPDLAGESRRDLHLFQQLSANPDMGLVADTPFRSPRTGHMLLPLGRALRGPDGRFAGMAVATLEPEQLRDFYRSLAAGANGRVTA